MVFQQFNLFPHLSILDNCTLAPIWVKKLPKKEAEEMGDMAARWEEYNAKYDFPRSCTCLTIFPIPLTLTGTCSL